MEFMEFIGFVAFVEFVGFIEFVGLAGKGSCQERMKAIMETVKGSYQPSAISLSPDTRSDATS